MKRIVFNTTDKSFEDLEELMEKRGFFNVSETLRWGISDLAERYLRNYREVKLKELEARPTPKDRADATLQAKKTREEMEDAEWRTRQMAIAERLGGKVENDIVYYQIFEELPGGIVEAYDDKTPLENLTEELVNSQYKTFRGEVGETAKTRIKALQDSK